MLTGSTCPRGLGVGFQALRGARRARALFCAATLLLAGAWAGCSTGGSANAPAANGRSLSIDPTSAWALATIQGSSPLDASQDYALLNDGEVTIDWMVLATQPWVQLSTSGGQLAIGASSQVTAVLDAAAVSALAAGMYSAEIEFHDLTTGEPPVIVPVTLAVTAAQSDLEVTPETGVSTSGIQGGPIAPASQVYTLTNLGNVPFAWNVHATQTWITLIGPMAGTLAPDASVEVTVEIDTLVAAGLPAGLHEGAVGFGDVVQGVPVALRDVSIDIGTPPAAGWTEFTPSADSRLVYVSPSGNDGNSGLSASAPKQSIAAGRALLREGYPDWLLLQKGGTWDYSFGTWTLSGRSATEPMLISSYGAGARPLLRTGGGAGVMTVTATGGSAKITDVAFVGLHFLANGYNGTSGQPTGFALLQTVENFLIEDCRVEGYRDSCVFTGGNPSSHRNIRMRRSLFLDNYSINNGFSQGMICAAVDGLLIEECLFDRCGVAQPSGFNHAIYIDNEGNKNIVVRGNIVSDAASHGLQLRPGGVAEDNLFVRTSIALQVGGGDSWQVNGNGVTGLVRRNVILDGKNIDGSNLRGWGILLQNIASIQVEDNVIANAPAAGNPRPIELDGWSTSHKIYDTTLRGNVVSGWGGAGLRVKGQGGSEIKNLVIDDNEVQNLVDANHLIEIDNSSATGEITSLGNDFYSAALSANAWFLLGGVADSLSGYKSAVGDSTSSGTQQTYAANATLAGYHASLGKPATHAAFIAEARKQSKDNWRPEYTADVVNTWIRAAFGK